MAKIKNSFLDKGLEISKPIAGLFSSAIGGGIAGSSGGMHGVVIGAVAYYLADVSNRGLSRIQENRALTALNIASREIEKINLQQNSRDMASDLCV
ncbi:hypothetical protein DMI60_16425 [Escherichia coli]|nr:hypothetical protein [Escherichia coli]